MILEERGCDIMKALRDFIKDGEPKPKLKIWPVTYPIDQDDKDHADYTKPLVILMHGLSGNIKHMEKPFDTNIKKTGHWNDTYKKGTLTSPDDAGWHVFPPTDGTNDIFEIAGWLKDLVINSINGENPDSDDFVKLLAFIGGSISPDLKDEPNRHTTDNPSWPDTKNPSWFEFFKYYRYPVIAYSQQGAKIPLRDDDRVDDREEGAFCEFLTIMEEIHKIPI